MFNNWMDTVAESSLRLCPVFHTLWGQRFNSSDAVTSGVTKKIDSHTVHPFILLQSATDKDKLGSAHSKNPTIEKHSGKKQYLRRKVKQPRTNRQHHQPERRYLFRIDGEVFQACSQSLWPRWHQASEVPSPASSPSRFSATQVGWFTREKKSHTIFGKEKKKHT